jgi:hypothetical protein
MLIGIGMPGFDWTTMQFAKGKETAKVPGQRVDYRHTRLEFHLQLLLMVLQACASNLLEKKITGTYYATAFPVGTALLRLGIPL